MTGKPSDLFFDSGDSGEDGPPRHPHDVPGMFDDGATDSDNVLAMPIRAMITARASRP